MVRGWFFVQKITLIATANGRPSTIRWYTSRAFYIWPHIYLVMVASNGKTIPKGAKVTTAALHMPKSGGGRRLVRLFVTDERHKEKWDIETPYEEHPTRKVTDPQDKIAKYKDYILHCWKEEKDFGWPMTSSMRKDSEEWQKGLRDQDPAIAARPEYYTKETLRRFRKWLKEECPAPRLFVNHSKWKDILSDVGRGKKDTIEGFFAHMKVALKKELVLFDSVQDQIDREKNVPRY